MKLFSATLSPPVLLLLIGILIVLIIVLMLIVLWRTRTKQEAAGAEPEAAPEAPAEPAPTVVLEKKETVAIVPAAQTSSSISSAVSFLRENSAGMGGRYRTPWFLVLGAAGSGKSTLLEHSGISLSLREGATNFGVSHGIQWRFFDAGVILDVPGDFFLRAGHAGSDERSFKTLLRNLVKHRPQRPIDGVVLAIPCSELVGPDAISAPVMEQRAAQIFDKLWMIEKWVGLSFPVYVIVTKCDMVPGFSSLARQLPSRYRREMFGWSNPYNVEAAFDPVWIDQGFEELAHELNRLQSEVFVEQQEIPDVDGIFLFSGKLHEMAKPLGLYLGQIFKTSAYRESLQFRGFYFIGDAPTEVIEIIEPQRALAAAASYSSSLEPSESLAITGDVLGLTPASHTQAQPAPIFVADLFENKIFPERGLARPVSGVRLSRNRWLVAAQAACLIVTLLLIGGIWFRYSKLARARDEFVPILDHVYEELPKTVTSFTPPTPQPRPADQAGIQAQQQRQRLLQQLNQVLQTKSTGKGLVVNLSDVLFDSGETTLKPVAKVPLAKLSGIISAYPDLKLEIDGYTDNTGGAELNQKLSELRAGAVRDFLVAQGVSSRNVAVRGFGQNDPIAANETPAGRQLNRRVELVVDGNTIAQEHELARATGTAESEATTISQFTPGEDTANSLVRSVQSTSASFRTIFYPTSLVDPMEIRLQRAMVPVFEELVFKSFRQQLLRKGQLLGMPGSTACPQNSAGALAQLDSYQRLCAFKTRLLELEANINIYNVITKPHSGDVHQLAHLEAYLSGNDLGLDENLQKHTHIFDLALELAHGDPINPHDVAQGIAVETMSSLTQKLFEEWFPSNPILVRLATIREKIDQLDDSQTAADLTELDEALKTVKANLANPQFDWLSEECFQLTPELSAVTNDVIQESKYFLRDKSEWLRTFVTDTGKAECNQATHQDQRTRLTGALLKVDNGVVHLSDSADKLRAYLEDVLKQPFAQRDRPDEIKLKGAAQQLIWNKDLLQEATTLEAQYQHFIKAELADVPPDLQEIFQIVALGRLEDGILELVAQAEKLEALPPSDDPEVSIVPELLSFQDAAPYLDTLLRQLQGLELDSGYEEVLNVSVHQASSLLARIDASFQAQSPYETPGQGFNRWNIDNTAIWAGFGAHNSNEISQYVLFQRQQAQQYATRAASLVNFLQGRTATGSKDTARLLSKWHGIVDDLQKFNTKVPGTSLAGLEDFIGVDMEKVTPDNCQPAVVTASGNNFFALRQDALSRSLYNRCRQLSEQNAVRLYTSIAKLFNAQLAGKFPFSPPPQEQTPSEADPADIEKLYSLLDSSSKSIHAGLQKGEFGDSYATVLSFLNQLDGLRPVFSALLTGQPDSAPAFDFIPVFRVNQGREINGNEIIDWTLQVGSESFRYRDPERTGRWNFGDPVKLSLRWAKDSPQRPASVRVDSDSKSSSGSLLFEYHDSWSLLRMILLHRPVPTDFDRMVDPDPQTLVFTVADTTSANPSTGTGDNSTPRTKVFVRIKLRSPGKPDNLRLRNFPTEAPDLNQSQARGASAGGNYQ